MRTNIHNWAPLFAENTCRVCFDRITTGTAKCNHALKHARQGLAIRTGKGTSENPFNYYPFRSIE
jgi:hypothetical protein